MTDDKQATDETADNSEIEDSDMTESDRPDDEIGIEANTETRTATDTETHDNGGSSQLIANQRTLREYAQWAAFAILVLVALIGTVRLYFSLSAAIETFVTRRYRPLFMAGFNLGVVLACVLGLSVLARRR